MRELKLKGKVNGQRNCMTGKREMRLSQKGKAACRLAQGSKSGSPMITVTLGSFKAALIGYLSCHLFDHLFDKEVKKENNK